MSFLILYDTIEAQYRPVYVYTCRLNRYTNRRNRWRIWVNEFVHITAMLANLVVELSVRLFSIYNISDTYKVPMLCIHWIYILLKISKQIKKVNNVWMMVSYLTSHTRLSCLVLHEFRVLLPDSLGLVMFDNPWEGSHVSTTSHQMTDESNLALDSMCPFILPLFISLMT